jgi:hypothetical protein
MWQNHEVSDLFRISDFGFHIFTLRGVSPIPCLLASHYTCPMNTREMTGKFQDWQRRATERAKDMGHATDDYVRENTWTTITIATLLGCVVGYLIATRRH